MPRRLTRSALLAAAVLVPALADAAAAQNRPAVSLSGGLRLYDRPDATETMPAVAIRSELPVGLLVLELAGSVADAPARTHLATTSVLEAQVQLPIAIGPTLTPYFGIGAGLAKTSRDSIQDEGAQTVLSVSAGVKSAISDQLGLVADARVRGIGTEFDGSHFDVTVGLRYQFGRPDRPRFRGAPRPRS